MPNIPYPPDELARLTALQQYAVLDTPPEAAFDDVVKLAAAVCHTPIALVTLIDESRQWFKARFGLAASETPREIAFCTYALLTPEEVFVVKDASQDERFAGNPMVTGEPGIRFYAGAPLITPGGQAVGTLCVIDDEPRDLAETERQMLLMLARTVITQLELRRVSNELNRANECLRTLSFVDPLTNLANRRALRSRLEEEMSRAQRHDAPLALLMLDVDHFKDYNDLFGHVMGDDVLRSFADILKIGIRPSDLVARYGGEEFAVLLPETTEAGARLLAERYCERVAEANFAGQHVTTSIGVATWHPRFESPEDFIDVADQALYAAKREGRNRVKVAEGQSRSPH